MKARNISGGLHQGSEPRGKRAMKVIGIIVFITLILSVVYALIRFLAAPSEPMAGAPYRKLKSDYLLMLTQCALGLLVMMLPSMLSRRWRIVLPDVIVVLYYIFLYCAIFLGEIFDFYDNIAIAGTIL